MKPVFDNPVYEKQRINIEKQAKLHPDDWFFNSQMEKAPEHRVGFAPSDGRCWSCMEKITEGDRGITVESLGEWIITGCPYCHRSYCD